MVFLRAFSSARVPYQAARARDIRRQNSCQSPLYVIAAQGAPPGLGEIEYLHSRIVGRCPAMLMSETGQNRKSSMRAYVFRFPPESGHCAMQSVCPFGCQTRTSSLNRRNQNIIADLQS